MDQHDEDLHSSEYKSNEIYYNYLKKHKDNPAILLASAKQVYKKFDNLRDNFQKLKKKYQKDRDRWDAWYAKAEKRKTEKQKLKVPLSEASNSVVNSPKKKVKRAIPKERSSEDKENEIDSRVKTEETVLEEYKLPKPTTQVLNEVDVFFIPPSPDRHLLRSNPQKKSPTSLSNQFNPSRPIAESNNTENRGKDKVTESIESKNIKKEEQETETLRRLSSNSRKRPLSSLTRDFSTPATFERKERLSQSVPAKFPISPRKGKRSLPEPSSPERFQKRPPLHLSPSVAKENKGRGRYASMMKKPDELDTTDFIVNPARNNGINYAYHEVVRGKEARKALHAHDCPCCKTFYDIAGPPPPSMAPRWRSHSPESNDVIQKVSRHRVNFERAPTPPGFWNSEFPDTQAREEVRQQAEEMRRRRALEREAESKKFGGGRYIKR